MLKFNSFMIGSSQPEVLGAFYEKVFGKPSDMSEAEAADGWYGWTVGGTYLTLGRHSEVKGQSEEPQRIIFNFETSEVQAEFDRIKGIEGAKAIKEPYELQGSWIATLADPDGNYFQLMTPWNHERDTGE